MSCQITFSITPTTLNEKELGDRIVAAIDGVLKEHVEGYSGGFDLGSSSTRTVFTTRRQDGTETHFVNPPAYMVTTYVHVPGAEIPPLKVVNPGESESSQ